LAGGTPAIQSVRAGVGRRDASLMTNHIRLLIERRVDGDVAKWSGSPAAKFLCDVRKRNVLCVEQDQIMKQQVRSLGSE